MARGNEIIVTAQPRGVFKEGIISGTPSPGAVMQIVAATEMVAGEFTYQAAAPGTDGKKVVPIILLADRLQGKLSTDAYVSGTRGFLYCPVPGEELNLLVGEVAGTGNTFAIGDRLIVDAEDGILVPDSGSPQECFAVCLETVTQVAGSHLTHCVVM